MNYKLRILIAVFIASLLSPINGFSADKVVLLNGSSYEGIIKGAEEDSVLISIDDKIIKIPRTDIKLIEFESSDIVIIKSGSNVEGKVVAKNGEDVIVATSEGIKTIKNFLIKKVIYNSGKTIRVSVFPVTDKFFSNVPGRTILIQEKGMLLAPYLNLASHYAFLSDWRDQYILEDGKNPSGGGFLIGFGVKLYIKSHIQVQAGYEYFGSQKIDVTLTQPNFTDRASYKYLYIGATYGFTKPNTPLTYFYGGLELGILTGKENVDGFDGIDLEISGSIPAIRYTIGIEQYVRNNLFLSADIAFLSANVDNLELLGIPIEGYSLDFSGITFGTKLGLRLPL